MADKVEVKIEGVDALVARLESLTYETKRKGGRSALRKAAQLVAKAAKANAAKIDDPETAENIEKNIALRWSSRRFKRTGDLMFRVGVMGGAGGNAPSSALDGLPGGDTRHWRYKEFGSENSPAEPFMRPALANNLDAATSEFVTHYNKAIDRALKKAAKTGGRA